MHDLERAAAAQGFAEFAETMVVALWETLAVYRGARAGKTRLFLASRVSHTALGALPGLRRKFRYRQTRHRG